MRSALILIIALLVSFRATSIAQPPVPEEKQIIEGFLSMKKDATATVVKRNSALLRSGKERTIWILKDHLNDPQPASPFFVADGDYRPPAADGSMSMGEVAFLFIREMIEGNLSKMYGKYAILTRETAAEWINARKGKSLEELRVDASTEILRKVKKLHEGRSEDFSKEIIAFFESRLKSRLEELEKLTREKEK